MDPLLDAVITDLDLPDQGGLELLRALRESGSDVPTVLLATQPSMRSAIEAVDHGAHAYLTDPSNVDAVASAVDRAVAHSKVARMREEALALAALNQPPQQRRRIDRALQTMWFAYQPLIDRTWSIVGYEALLRNEDSELRSPLALLEAARQTERREELARAIWDVAPGPLPQLDSGQKLFMNVDLDQLSLVREIAKSGSLRGLGSMIVLEITEHASRQPSDSVELDVAALKAMGFQIAVDDLGAAYSGLAAFSQLDPDYVKLDGNLIRDIDANDRRRRLISGIVRLCGDLGISVVAECVETRDEFEALKDVGCHLFQGFFVGMPERWKER